MTPAQINTIITQMYNCFLWLVVFLVLFNFVHFLVSTFAFYFRFRALHSENIDRFTSSPSFPGVTFLMPCKNEEEHIITHIEALLNLQYRNKQIIVINDGSTDNSLLKLIEHFKMVKLPAGLPQRFPTSKINGYYRSSGHPNLMVIDKVNGGKADALNAAINLCNTPYFVSADADTFIESEGFHRAMFSFLTVKDAVALGSPLSVLNECSVVNGKIEKVVFPRNLLAGIQTLEYMRGFFNFRAGASLFGGNMVVPGAFGIFDRKSVQSVGGYPTDTVTEDLGLTMRLYRKLKGEGRPFTIDFVPASVAWTIVPDKIKPLWQQRERWQRGTLKVLGQYWFFFLNPYYGLLGLVGFPLILLETLFPLIEIACYFLAFTAFFAGVLNWDFLVQGLIAGIALSMLMSAIALFVEELTFRRYPLIRNLPQILLYALIECVGLRHWLLLARIQAFWKVLRRDNQWRSGKITIVKQ